MPFQPPSLSAALRCEGCARAQQWDLWPEFRWTPSLQPKRKTLLWRSCNFHFRIQILTKSHARRQKSTYALRSIRLRYISLSFLSFLSHHYNHRHHLCTTPCLTSNTIRSFSQSLQLSHHSPKHGHCVTLSSKKTPPSRHEAAGFPSSLICALLCFLPWLFSRFSNKPFVTATASCALIDVERRNEKRRVEKKLLQPQRSRFRSSNCSWRFTLLTKSNFRFLKPRIQKDLQTNTKVWI